MRPDVLAIAEQAFAGAQGDDGGTEHRHVWTGLDREAVGQHTPVEEAIVVGSWSGVAQRSSARVCQRRPHAVIHSRG